MLRKAAAADLFTLRRDIPLRVQVLDAVNQSKSERHLLRLFIDHASISPLHYLRLIRLERARQSLEYGATVTRAAAVAGFGSDLQLRRAWSRQWGGSPRDAARAAGPNVPAPRANADRS